MHTPGRMDNIPCMLLPAEDTTSTLLRVWQKRCIGLLFARTRILHGSTTKLPAVFLQSGKPDRNTSQTQSKSAHIV